MGLRELGSGLRLGLGYPSFLRLVCFGAKKSQVSVMWVAGTSKWAGRAGARLGGRARARGLGLGPDRVGLGLGLGLGLGFGWVSDFLFACVCVWVR